MADLQWLVDKVFELGNLLSATIARLEHNEGATERHEGLYDRVNRLESDVEMLKADDERRDESDLLRAQTAPAHRQTRIAVWALLLGAISLLVTIVLAIVFHGPR